MSDAASSTTSTLRPTPLLPSAPQLPIQAGSSYSRDGGGSAATPAYVPPTQEAGGDGGSYFDIQEGGEDSSGSTSPITRKQDTERAAAIAFLVPQSPIKPPATPYSNNNNGEVDANDTATPEVLVEEPSTSTNISLGEERSTTTTSFPQFDVPPNDLTPTGLLPLPVTVDALTLKNHLAAASRPGPGLNVGGTSDASLKGSGRDEVGGGSGLANYIASGSAVIAAISESSRGLKSALSSRVPPTHAANMPVRDVVDQSNNAVAQRMLEAEWCKLAPRRNVTGGPYANTLSLGSRVGMFLVSSSWVIFPLLLINIIIDLLIVGFFVSEAPKARLHTTSIAIFEAENIEYLFFVNTGLTLAGFVFFVPCAHFLYGYFSIPTIVIYGLTAYQLSLIIMYGYAKSHGVYVDGKGYAIRSGEENGLTVVQTVYVPYFLRLWGAQAHVKTLVSVMAWRSGLERFKILRELFSVVALLVAAIFTSAGLFQVIEFSQSNIQYSMLETIYWTVVTFSTVGYGEISPDSALAEALVIGLIFAGLALVPVFINVIEYVALMWPKYNSYTSAGRRHVVVSANITHKEMRMLLDEMIFVDQHTDMVFVSSNGFSLKCRALLRDVKYCSRLTLIEGSIRDRSVIKRARLSSANAAILMSAKFSVAMRGDYATLRDSVSLRNFDKNLPQYLWLKYGTHDHLLEGVFCVTHGLRYLRTFLATASVLPGIVPFIVNLIRTQSQSKMLVGREKKTKKTSRLGSAVRGALFGSCLSVESSSSDEDDYEMVEGGRNDDGGDGGSSSGGGGDWLRRDPLMAVTNKYNNTPERRRKRTAPATTPLQPTSNKDNVPFPSPNPSRRSSQTSASTDSGLPWTRPPSKQTPKRLHIPGELSAEIATDEDVLKRAFKRKYMADWELLYNIGRFNSLLLVDAPEAYFGRPYNVCILHAHLHSRALLVGIVRDGNLIVNPTVDHPFGKNDEEEEEQEGSPRNGLNTTTRTNNTSSNPGSPCTTTTTAAIVNIKEGDQFMAIMPRILMNNFGDVCSEEVSECDNVLNRGGRFDHTALLDQTINPAVDGGMTTTMWDRDGGIGGGSESSSRRVATTKKSTSPTTFLTTPSEKGSPKTPSFNKKFGSPKSNSSPKMNNNKAPTMEDEADTHEQTARRETMLVEEEARIVKRKDTKAHFLIMDVPTELLDPGYTTYERNLSERTRLWNLSLIMRSIMSVHANSKITLISPLPLSKKFYAEWTRQGFPMLELIQGSALNSHTVQNAISTDRNTFTDSYHTQGVIIFTSSQGARSLGDAPLYGAFTSVRKVLSNNGRSLDYDTQVVMELSTFSASNLVGPFHDDLRLRRDSEEDFQMSIPFMTGKVFATDMLQPMLVQTYGNPFASDFYAKLFNLSSARQRHENERKQEEMHRRASMLQQAQNDEDDEYDLACMGGATAGFDTDNNQTSSTLFNDDSAASLNKRGDGLQSWVKRRQRRTTTSESPSSSLQRAPLALPTVSTAVNFRVFSNRRLQFLTFGEAFRHLLVSRGMLVVGVFRLFPMEMEGTPRYMITNPPAYADLSVTDHLYCFVPWKAPPSSTGNNNTGKGKEGGSAGEGSSCDAEDGTNPTDSDE